MYKKFKISIIAILAILTLFPFQNFVYAGENQILENVIPVEHDIEISVNEARITSTQNDSVADEFKIISLPEVDESSNNSFTMYIFIGGILILLTTIFTVFYKTF